ncbi:MAG: phasin family protein [Pseudomonadota bacterium]
MVTDMPFSTFTPETFAKLMPMPDAFGTLAQDAVVASTESTRASFKGMQETGTALMQHAKDQVALSVETGKKFSEVTSVEDAMALQTTFVKSAFEANMKSFSEISELYTETMREAFAPLAKQAKKASKATA